MITLVSIGIAIILFLIFATIIGAALFFFNQATFIDAKIKNVVNICVSVLLVILVLFFLLQLLQGGTGIPLK